MAKTLKFGGPNLQAPSHTWYVRKDTGAQVDAYPGDEVDADEIENAQYYVDSGRAEFVGRKSKATPEQATP